MVLTLADRVAIGLTTRFNRRPGDTHCAYPEVAVDNLQERRTSVSRTTTTGPISAMSGITGVGGLRAAITGGATTSPGP